MPKSFPIKTAPRDRPILVHGACSWERLDPSGTPGWRVAEWTDELTWDEECEPVGGWKSITSNPYKDYVVATCWAELPETLPPPAGAS